MMRIGLMELIGYLQVEIQGNYVNRRSVKVKWKKERRDLHCCHKERLEWTSEKMWSWEWNHSNMEILWAVDWGDLVITAVETHWVCGETQDWRGLGLRRATLLGFPLCTQETWGYQDTRGGHNDQPCSVRSHLEFLEI